MISPYCIIESRTYTLDFILAHNTRYLPDELVYSQDPYTLHLKNHLSKKTFSLEDILHPILHLDPHHICIDILFSFLHLLTLGLILHPQFPVQSHLGVKPQFPFQIQNFFFPPEDHKIIRKMIVTAPIQYTTAVLYRNFMVNPR